MKIDWTNKEQVIAYAKRLGSGMTVMLEMGRANYNITHTSRKDQWDLPNVIVVYQS